MAHLAYNGTDPIIYNCWFDGATEKTNPCKKMGYGNIIKINGELLRTSCASYIRSNDRNGTNNYSEYLGLIDILDFFKNNDGGRVINIYGDSKMVIEQMTGNWKIKEGIYYWKALEAKAKLGELQEVCKVNIKWIPREENKEADLLSKEGLDLGYMPKIEMFETSIMPF